MLYVSESLLTKNGAKILGCRIVDYVGTLLEYLHENYPHELENGTLTQSLFDGDDELYLSSSGRMLYVYRVKPDEESHFRCCIETLALQKSLEAKHRKHYDKSKNEKPPKG